MLMLLRCVGIAVTCYVELVAVEVEVWRPEWGECEPVCTWTLTHSHNDHTSGNYSEINTDKKN